MVLALAAMAVVIAPVAGMTLGQQDDGNDPVGTETRQSYDLLAEAFGPGTNGPLLVVADLGGATSQGTAPFDQAQAQAITQELAGIPGVARSRALSCPTAAMRRSGRLFPRRPPATPPPETWSRDCAPTSCRELAPEGAEVYVGGQTAAKIDFTDRVAERLPSSSRW